MRKTKTAIEGAYILTGETHTDERGSFSVTYSAEELERLELHRGIEQVNVVFNPKKNTIRGMHYQSAPFEEVKIVRCLTGRIHDVIIDLRPDSQTFEEWFSVQLHGDEPIALYVPKGCAHGYQTLEDNTIVQYTTSTPYVHSFSRGIAWNDMYFDNWLNKYSRSMPRDPIDWVFMPGYPRTINFRDSHYAPYKRQMDDLATPKEIGDRLAEQVAKPPSGWFPPATAIATILPILPTPEALGDALVAVEGTDIPATAAPRTGPQGVPVNPLQVYGYF